MGGIQGVELGFLIGAVPTAAMIASSVVMANLHVSKYIEATFQNFASGLILAAVAAELFPLMLENVDEKNTWIGVSAGFFIGLSTLYGMEALIEFIVGESDEGFQKMEVEMNSPMKQIINKINENTPHDILSSEIEELMSNRKSHSEWEEEPVRQASVAISRHGHRSHITTHVAEILKCIQFMEQKCNRLMGGKTSAKEHEALSEEIDEATHILQYKIDHCRRLLQGAETDVETKPVFTEDKIEMMKKTLLILKGTGEHLLDHLKEEHINVESLKEVFHHMNDMNFVIDNFHDAVEATGHKWILRHREMPEPQVGDTLPFGLVIPVILDCFVDGFLIGVSCALSPQAGIVLGFANCMEMSFLGMAYSVRLKKCTGSTWLARQTALFFPPLLMFLASGLGAFIAALSKDTPAIFVGFVAFGTVALVALVCNELLIEAKNTMGDEEVWYVNLSLFAAIYLVLMIDRVM